MSGVISGPAQPVITSTEAPDGGPARPVAVVSAPLYTLAGPPLKVVEVTDNRARIGGPAMPVVVASGAAAGSPIAGAPIPVYVVSGSLNSNPVLGSPSFAATNTTFTNAMGPDGWNWAQGGKRGPIEVDAFGKLLAISEDAGGNHAITYSNNAGATWSDALSLGFLTRGAVAYNTADDRLEVCWLAQAATDGILFRRYAPTRDGSNNITGWTVVGAGYAILDAQTTGTMEYQHPCITWLNDAAYGAHGAVVCVWAARNTGAGGVGNEIRAAMRILSNTADDFSPANWTHIGVNSATTIGNAPGTASYTAVLANAASGVPHPALLRLANNDLFVGYHDGTVTGGRMAGAWAYRRGTWAAGSNNWTALTAAAPISNLVRAGADAGYANKGELLSKPAEDSAGNVYLGIATWKSNALGDTWGFAQITPGDVVTLADDYSSAGGHSYAPTGDIDYDTAADRIISSYITTSDQFAYVHLFDGVAAAGDPVLAIDVVPCDIPLIRTQVVPGKLAMLTRSTDTPHVGYFGTMTWS